MNTKYCLPIIKNTKKETLGVLRTKGYDFYEVWLDYIQNLDSKFILSIAKKLNKKLIFVFRRKNLEKVKLSTDKRQKIIARLLRFNVTLDIDFLTQHEELEFLRQKQTNIKLILSFHNYKETPTLDFLKKLINKMKRYNPSIYKISTFCQKEEDAFILLNLLLWLKRQNLKYIVLGMGNHGLITRIFGAVWGNMINFAPLNLEEKSAPGQLTKKQLELILKEIT